MEHKSSLFLAAPNPCEDENMNPEDLKCLACTDASSDKDCRENGVYEDCDGEVETIKTFKFLLN